MFESEIIVWLQSHASDGLTLFMRHVSGAGEGGVYRLIALVVVFGLNFRVGALLLQILLLTAFATDLLKDVVALPRPVAADSDVVYLASETPHSSPFDDGDADGFFGLPDARAITHVRALPDPTFGFPSGHVSRATALTLGAALLLRSRLLGVVAALFIPLMALSRVYLGAHFLADVLGGFLLGSVIALVVSRTLGMRTRAGPPPAWVVKHAMAATLALLALFLIAPLPFALTPLDEFGGLGRLVAGSVAFTLVAIRGTPGNGGAWHHRAGRVVAAVGVYFVASNCLDELLAVIVFQDHFYLEYIAAGVPLGVCLLATTPLAVRLRLYPRIDTAGRPAMPGQPEPVAAGAIADDTERRER